MFATRAGVRGVVRRLATLSTKEEFPSSITVTPAVRAAAVIKEATTSNGVKLIARDSGASMVSINFAVLCGSRAETLSEKGAAHLLAVAAFSGTGKRSGLRLMRDLENLGATVGATVDREKITYKVTCLPEQAEAAVAAVAEAITSPPASAYVVEEMKDTAQLTIDAHKACPREQVMELLYEAAYGENTPMGSPTYGPLDKLDVGAVMDFRRAHFSAPNVVVSASGLSIEALKTMAELYLHALPAASSSHRALPMSPYVGGDMKVRADVGASHLALAFPVPKGAAAEPYKVLFGLLSSKAAAMPIPKLALQPFFQEHASGCLLGFYAKGHAQEAAGFLEAGVAELKALAASANADGAKVRTALQAFLAVEGSSDAAASSLLQSALAGVPPLSDARKVTSASVSAAAKAALASVPSYAVYGSTMGTPSYSSVVKMTK